MKLHPSVPIPAAGPEGRRGAALMLALLVLFVLVAITFQIRITTDTDARVGRNQIVQQRIDLAIESALLELLDQLALDAESAGGGDTGGAGGLGGAGADPFGGLAGMMGSGGGDPAAGGAGGGATDSKMDDWARPQRTEINGVRLRILVQDEDSKLNVLSMLTEDEDEALKAFERVVRALEFCRGGTDFAITPGDAREMAEQMRDFMRDRTNQILPRPKLLTDDEEDDAFGLPLTLRELIVLPAFEEDHFRDFVDESGNVVHSIESFLTMWTGLSTAQEVAQEQASGPDQPGGAGEPSGAGQSGGARGGGGAGGLPPVSGMELVTETAATAGSGGGGAQGFGDPQSGAGVGLPGAGGVGGGGAGVGTPTGITVNVNTASNAVLHTLMDPRDVDERFWDDVVEYRNQEEEDDDPLSAAFAEEEDLLDEFGQAVEELQIFDDLEELREIRGWENLEPIAQAEMKSLLTVQSNVFSIYITGRVLTGVDQTELVGLKPNEIEEVERQGNALTRTIRCIVWRRMDEDSGEVELVPLVRWEPIDYIPWDVQDYPDEDRTHSLFQ